MLKKKLVIVFLTISTSISLYGCVKFNPVDKLIKENEIIKKYTKYKKEINLDDIFTGLWMNNGKYEKTYFKIRKDCLEYQSNTQHYNNYEMVERVEKDPKNNYIYLTTIDDNNETSETKIEIIDKNTIMLNEFQTLTKVDNLKNVAIDLQTIYEVDAEYCELNGLNNFLDISQVEALSYLNVNLMGEITESELEKVKSLMNEKEAISIATNFIGQDTIKNESLKIAHTTPYKFGEMTGYIVQFDAVVNIEEEEVNSYPYEEIFIEARSKEIGRFMRGFGYVQMLKN